MDEDNLQCEILLLGKHLKQVSEIYMLTILNEKGIIIEKLVVWQL